MNKEVFDAELNGIEVALEIVLQGGRTRHETSRLQREPPWTRIYIWEDSQVAIKRL